MLPPEIVIHILGFLPPDDPTSIPTILSCALVSRDFLDISLSSAVWSSHAASTWTRGSVLDNSTSPYTFYKLRARTDSKVRQLVVNLALKTHSRLEDIEAIRKVGLDALDALEGLKSVTEEVEPEYWMSMRYWASSAWEAILRDEAGATWKRIAEETINGSERESSFEDGVLAFTAFRSSDPEKVRTRFDRAMPDLEIRCHHTLQQPTAALVHIAKAVRGGMKALGLRPAEGDEYHNLNNHFLNEVWDDADLHADSSSRPRGTLPMSLVAIFCSLVRRLPPSFNVKVNPIGFPGVVLAALSPRDDSTDPIYFSVFDDKVLGREELRGMVERMGITMSEEYLRPASAQEMCHRVARNILHSVRTRNAEFTPTALYAAARGFYQFSPPPVTVYADWLVTLVQSPDFSHDVAFLESDELRRNLGSDEKREEVRLLCESIRSEDKEEPERRAKSPEIVWKIGHVFVHSVRKLCVAVTTSISYGSTHPHSSNLAGIQQMQVDSLPNGRHQPFYHVVCSDGSKLYVASENIQTMDVPPRRFADLAGVKSMGLYFRKLGVVDGRPGFIKSEALAAEFPDG
ncbi:F-box protein 21, partial [Phenoliferia sp. Uapishka_3]